MQNIVLVNNPENCFKHCFVHELFDNLLSPSVRKNFGFIKCGVVIAVPESIDCYASVYASIVLECAEYLNKVIIRAAISAISECRYHN